MDTTLTKKYRLIWDGYTLNIQNEYEKDCAGTASIISHGRIVILFESDVYQEILDKIEEKGLHPIGEWIEYEDI